LSSSNRESEVAVAKIGRTQAIAVALITAIGGVAAGYTARGGTDATREMQHWIEVASIGSKSSSLVRLVITVNGINYFYPSKAVWAEIGPSMSKERFPLPIEPGTYRVSFAAFLSERGSAPTLRAESQEVMEFSVDKLPQKGQVYSLYPVEGSYRAAVRDVTIGYSIEAVRNALISRLSGHLETGYPVQFRP